MSTAYLPGQQNPEPAPRPVGPDAVAPVPPHASEATRLLCAGTYLDAGYRDRVIEQLHLHMQRFVAPSLGLDAARVLAHALRARRRELGWAGLSLGLWAAGGALTRGLVLFFLAPSVSLWIGRWIRGRAEQPPVYRRVLAFYFRWGGRLEFAALCIGTVLAAFGAGGGGSSVASSSEPPSAFDLITFKAGTDVLAGVFKLWEAWAAIVLLLLIAGCELAGRIEFAASMAAELSPRRFPDAAADPAERSEGQRFRRLAHRIRTEQHAPLIMYEEARPFRGAGEAYDIWVLSVELRPDEMKKQQPISNRAVLERIRPLLERLRLPAEYAGPGVRDRLRALEIDECVFLPAEGLLRRDEAPYQPQQFEFHRAQAVEEGAEKRRHFLRIRVGGWEEELVVTVFVRIHTQGRMLMLEIAPHVLQPVREDFKDADRAAHRFRHNNHLGKAVWALARVPGSPARCIVVIGRMVAYLWRQLTGGYTNALPEGPALSVRELGAAEAGSLFHEMDVLRYLKSIQDRVANGVRSALAECGYQTGEFVQQVNNISNGGVHIRDISGGTFAFGDHARVSSSTSPAPSASTPSSAASTPLGGGGAKP
ncbi:hypothetical protein [Streptomyces sp. NPDC047000]|uniref:hypothetical protein n=1 Tax=Streptomyces sp. NPDC047000 TaxID=3155474 RepID=UPI0033D46285